MSLYERNFTTITDEERLIWEEMKEQEKSGLGNLRKRNLFLKYPKAVRHYLSLFPNHYLDVMELRDEARLQNLTEQFLLQIENPKANELSIMKFIKQNKAYFIIASLFKDYNFGHHEAYVIPEFLFGNTYRVDYLLIGKNSGGYEFVLVELEHPYKDITTKNGDLGSAFRKGIKQIDDWKRYLVPNFMTLEETFLKYINPNIDIPREFIKPDITRIHYVVVAGRRCHFDDNTYWIKRNKRENEKINLLHYDNLYDYAVDIIGTSTY